MSEGLRVVKSTCERYDLRWGKGWNWATFTIDERSGLFNCISDYGSYNYAWPNHGRKSFKHFILELARDWSYFLGKVSRETHFDFEANLKRWEQTIVKLRKDRECTKEQAREVWDFIHDLDSCWSYQLIQKELYESSIIAEIVGGEPWYYFETELEYPPNARVFAKEVMPMFAEILKKEIEQQEVKNAQ